MDLFEISMDCFLIADLQDINQGIAPHDLGSLAIVPFHK